MASLWWGSRCHIWDIRLSADSQESLAHKAKVHRTYVGPLKRGESGVTVEALAAILEGPLLSRKTILLIGLAVG